jgi:hypothetical protein
MISPTWRPDIQEKDPFLPIFNQKWDITDVYDRIAGLPRYDYMATQNSCGRVFVGREKTNSLLKRSFQ